jgi:hypothetical protein
MGESGNGRNRPDQAPLPEAVVQDQEAAVGKTFGVRLNR